MKLKTFILSSLCIVSVGWLIFVFAYYIYEHKIVYACSEVTKGDPIDVQKLCERITKRRIQ